MIEKFSCVRCGNCCKNFGDKKSSFAGPFFASHNLICLSYPGLVIFPWEAKMFPKDSLIPFHVVFDIKSNKVIVLQYSVHSSVCPNLKDDVCAIYEERPNVCRAFPCFYDGTQEDFQKGLRTAFGFCKAEIPVEDLNNMLGIEQLDDGKVIINYSLAQKGLYLRYGSAFVSMIMRSALMKQLGNIINSLEEKGMMNCAKQGYDFNFLMKRIAHSDSVDVDMFIKDKAGLDIKELLDNKMFDEVDAMLKEQISRSA